RARRRRRRRGRVTGFERLLELLEARGPLRRVGREYRTRCPAHDDHEPSLDVRDAGDGTPLVVCRSRGCTFEQVLAALGLTPAELLNGDHRTSDPLAIYRYLDEQGVTLFEVGRFVGKRFVQRRPGAADWKGGIGGVRRVLYRLPRLREAIDAGETIYVA